MSVFEKVIEKTDRLDKKILIALQLWRPKFLNYFFIFLTHTGTSYTWFIIAGILLALNYFGINFVTDFSIFMRCLLAPLVSWLLWMIIKKIFSRPRPSSIVIGHKPIIVPPTCGSFPSVHTSAAFAFYFALILTEHSYAPFIGSWAVLIAFSRMYLGVHYLSDITGGVILGFISAFSIYALF
jgi:undecaprenyl-diphosphatase